MKVLLVTGSFPPMRCGVGDYTSHLASALSMLDSLNVAILTDCAASLSNEGYDYEVYPIIDGKYLSINKAVKLFRNWKPDIVHFQYPTMGYKNWKSLPLYLPIITWLMRIPIVMTWHEPVIEGRNSLFKAINYLIFALIWRGLIYVRPNYLDLIPSWLKGIIRKNPHRLISNASTIPAITLSEEGKISVRKNLAVGDSSLVVYFGFANPNKNVEQVFEVANPDRDFIILICDLDPTCPYHKKIIDIAHGPTWKGKVKITGFLPPYNVAEIIETADAAVLPLEGGGGIWNTSIHAVLQQGTFLLTTSRKKHGYMPTENIYYAKPNDVSDMSHALDLHLGQKGKKCLRSSDEQWVNIASEHADFYRRSILKSL